MIECAEICGAEVEEYGKKPSKGDYNFVCYPCNGEIELSH